MIKTRIIEWKTVSCNLVAMRTALELEELNKRIAKFCCGQISPEKEEFSKKHCNGNNCSTCTKNKMGDFVSVNALAKALSIHNSKNGWYKKAKITTDMLRLWECCKVNPPIEYIALLSNICNVKIENILFENIATNSRN